MAHGCVTLVSGPLLTWPSPPHTYTPVSSPLLPRTPVIRAHPTPRWPHRNQLRLRRPISKSGHFGKFWPDVHLLGRGRCSICCSSLPFMPKKVLAGKAENVRLFQEKGKMVKRHFQFWKPMPCALKTDDDDALIWLPPAPQRLGGDDRLGSCLHASIALPRLPLRRSWGSHVLRWPL